MVVDANVLIDYLAADVTILQRVSCHLGTIHIPRQVLREVPRIDPDDCRRLDLRIVDETVEQLLEAGQHRGRLSFHDQLCLILARDADWMCVTNDRALPSSDGRHREGGGRCYSSEQSAPHLRGAPRTLRAPVGGGVGFRR